jgi:toxin YoeB
MWFGRLFGERRCEPFEGTGKPEPLTGDPAGYRPRRIDRELRLVYRVTAGAVGIIQCRHRS